MANMSAIKKLQCKNDATFTYSGKEMSPLGLGYCANAEQVGTMMMGRDKTMWMVGMRNNVKVWNRVPSELAEAATAPMKKEEPLLSEEEAPRALESNAEPPVAKKKVVKKVAKVTEAAKEAEPEKEVDPPAAEKKTRKPNAYNIYMKYRMKTIADDYPNLTHKEKFTKAASEWKEMDAEAKAAVMQKAADEGVADAS
jgi:hypothetical protein